MSAAKHTPGPWLAKRLFNSAAWVLLWPSAAGQHMKRIDCAGEFTEQDAKLIAAAPDLLGALESFLRAPSVGSGGPGSSTIVVQEFNLRAARAAIAKATGSAA